MAAFLPPKNRSRDHFVDQLPPGDEAVVIVLWETNRLNILAASLAMVGVKR